MQRSSDPVRTACYYTARFQDMAQRPNIEGSQRDRHGGYLAHFPSACRTSVPAEDVSVLTTKLLNDRGGRAYQKFRSITPSFLPIIRSTLCNRPRQTHVLQLKVSERDILLLSSTHLLLSHTQPMSIHSLLHDLNRHHHHSVERLWRCPSKSLPSQHSLY